LNKLILEILPLIEATAKRVTPITDQQNELRQYTVIECYKYEDTVKRIHSEGKIAGWLYQVIKREYVRQKKGNTIDVIREIEDVIYEDKLEELKPLLTHVERLWLRSYIEFDGKFSEFKKKKIHRVTASLRIKQIIEKCKQLKHTLY